MELVKKVWNSQNFWEGIGYLTLLLCIFGQVTVGYWYLLAQGVYLTSNICSVVRDFAMKLPKSNIVKDIAFTGITAGLIVIKIIL